MNRWAQQLKDHTVWTTAATIEAHISAEPADASDDFLSEKRRLAQFVAKLLETLNALNAEQTPFNRLDEFDSLLNQHVAIHTEAYSTSGEVQYLRNANNQLQGLMSELCILRFCTQPIGEQGQVKQLDKLFDEFTSKVNSKQKEGERRSTEIEVKLGQQEQRLNKLDSHTKTKEAELNSHISNWQNQFNEAQQVRQTEYNTAHQQREKTFNGLLKATGQSAEEAIGKLVSERDSQLKVTLDDAKTESNELIGSTKKELNEAMDDCQKKRKEILELHQLVAGDSTTAGYAKNADDEREQAKFWRWISIAFTIVTVIWLICVILFSNVLGGGSLNWADYPVIVSLTGVLLFGASYGAQQSTRHQNNERRNRGLALKMAAFEPFISSLNNDQKTDLRSKVSEQLFNSAEPEEHSNSKEWKTIDRLVNNIIRIIKSNKQ